MNNLDKDSSLVLELQKDILSDKIGVSDLVRKALLTSRKLDAKQIENWLKKELDGYSTDEELPQYRFVDGEVKYWHDYQGRWITITFTNKKDAEKFKNLRIIEPIGKLQYNFSKSKDGSFASFDLSHEMEQYLLNSMKINSKPRIHINEASLAGIIDAVKNAILDWSSILEKDKIMGYGLSFSNDELEKAQNIHSSTNYFLGDISNFQLQQSTKRSTQIQSISQTALNNIQKWYKLVEKDQRNLGLSEENESILRDILQVLATELKSSNPKKVALQANISAIRRILESVAANVIANNLLQGAAILAESLNLS